MRPPHSTGRLPVSGSADLWPSLFCLALLQSQSQMPLHAPGPSCITSLLLPVSLSQDSASLRASVTACPGGGVTFLGLGEAECSLNYTKVSVGHHAGIRCGPHPRLYWGLGNSEASAVSRLRFNCLTLASAVSPETNDIIPLTSPKAAITSLYICESCVDSIPACDRTCV